MSSDTVSRRAAGIAVLRIRAAYARIAEIDRPELWITLRPEEDAIADAQAVDALVALGARLPLAGTVVAVKDNVDVVGLPTTAGCPAFAYAPLETAPAVARLQSAGAVVLGKTNLDQFATGLVGTRSPYGAVASAGLPDRVAGGSSSGSAVAVALGIADLGVGTDTAGSGRVPAAFNGIVGVKPTIGLVPTDGVVPASRSYDCVTVFATTVSAAQLAAGVMAGGSPGRPWPADAPLAAPPGLVVAVPAAGSLPELDPSCAARFEEVVSELAEHARLVRVDPEPFLEGGSLLYGSTMVAERYAAIGAFVDEHPDEVDPSVGAIVAAARSGAAYELARDFASIARLRRRALESLGEAQVLLLPTAPFHPTLAAVAADPIALNRRLGAYCSFANPFDVCAVAVPAGEAGGGPFGVTVFARPFHDAVAADVARLLTGESAPEAPPPGPPAIPLLVLGAHMSGQPLERELHDRGGRFWRAAATAASYRMYALPTTPPKPGLVHVNDGGAVLAGELWHLPPAGLAALLAELPPPLTLGPVELDDGTRVTGFLCQPSAVADARDISGFGGWRGYLEAAG